MPAYLTCDREPEGCTSRGEIDRRMPDGIPVGWGVYSRLQLDTDQIDRMRQMARASAHMQHTTGVPMGGILGMAMPQQAPLQEAVAVLCPDCCELLENALGGRVRRTMKAPPVGEVQRRRHYQPVIFGAGMPDESVDAAMENDAS